MTKYEGWIRDFLKDEIKEMEEEEIEEYEVCNCGLTVEASRLSFCDECGESICPSCESICQDSREHYCLECSDKMFNAYRCVNCQEAMEAMIGLQDKVQCSYYLVIDNVKAKVYPLVNGSIVADIINKTRWDRKMVFEIEGLGNLLYTRQIFTTSRDTDGKIIGYKYYYYVNLEGVAIS